MQDIPAVADHVVEASESGMQGKTTAMNDALLQLVRTVRKQAYHCKRFEVHILAIICERQKFLVKLPTWPSQANMGSKLTCNSCGLLRKDGSFSNFCAVQVREYEDPASATLPSAQAQGELPSKEDSTTLD